MKNLGIVLTLAVVACVFQTSSATSAPGITMTASMTFNGTWDAIYSNMAHANTSSMATALCTAITTNANKVKTCNVNSFSNGSVVASLTLTAAGTETSTTLIASIDQVKTSITASITSAGYNIGTMTSVVDTTSTATTTTAPSTATTLSTSVIMYLTVLCATAKAVLF